MRKYLYLLVVLFLCSGCASGYMTSSSYDSATGKYETKKYTPFFSSDSVSLVKDAEFRVSVVITRRVEPISHSLLTSIGGLGPDDLYSSATAVFHFKNDSNDVLKLNLKSLNILNNKEILNLSEIVLLPGAKFSTREIKTRVSTYNTEFNLKLIYDINGIEKSQSFYLIRQTPEDLKKKER